VISIETAGVFAVAAILLVVTPGPNMLLILSISAAKGARDGLLTLIGVQIANYSHAILAGLGISGLALHVPYGFETLKISGALYLLWLAWGAWRAPSVLKVGAAEVKRGTFALIGQGFLTNMLNPKVILFFLALFPQFIAPERGSFLLQSLELVTIHALFGTLILSAVALSAARLRRTLLSRPAISAWLNRALAAVFAGLAVRLLVAPRG
jgi:threonine/homoserine/homoserine lactone efflux protein